MSFLARIPVSEFDAFINADYQLGCYTEYTRDSMTL